MNLFRHEQSRMNETEMSLKKMQDRLREEEKRVILNGDNFLNNEEMEGIYNLQFYINILTYY